MPGEAQVLTLDLGTSGAKAAVFAASGQVLSTAFQPVALRLTTACVWMPAGENQRSRL